MIDLQETISLNIKGHDIPLTFPNTGQFRAIEVQKSLLSYGAYNAMVKSNTRNSNFALDMIDVQATLSVLYPKFEDEVLKCSFAELGVKDFIELNKVYKNEVVPWFNGWLKMIDENYK